MQTPSKLKPDELVEAVERWTVQYCDHPQDSGYTCKHCGSGIQVIDVCFSIHQGIPGLCAGFGKVLHLAIPFCPKCEPVPSNVSCIHLEGGRPLLVVEKSA